MSSDKGRKKSTDTLRELVNVQKGLLDGIYDDLFSGLGKKRPASEPRYTQEDWEKDLAALKSSQERLSADDALVNAEDALKEARELIASSPQAVPQEEAAPEEPEEDPLEQMDALVGLESIKHDVRELTSFVRIQKLRQEKGMKSVPVSLHLVFTGNPGTGKTTIARILSRIYKKIGVLSKGQLVEVDRSGLVAGFVGQTALKTMEQVNKAKGGVLFIDEAYALSRKDDTFGQEAIDTILKAMEDNRDDLVVIVAGYTRPMEEFINSNPGLKSRFNKYIEFPDYTIDELMEIFERNCQKYDYVLEEDAKNAVRAELVSRKANQRQDFANAREVRNLFEEIITNQAGRIEKMENPADEDIMKILLEDLVDDEIPVKKEQETAGQSETCEDGQDEPGAGKGNTDDGCTGDPGQAETDCFEG